MKTKKELQLKKRLKILEVALVELADRLEALEELAYGDHNDVEVEATLLTSFKESN